MSKIIRLANGPSVTCSPAKEGTVRGIDTLSEGLRILNEQVLLSGERMTAFHAGREQAKQEVIQILESHLISHTCPLDTEPNALVIDIAALEEIKKL